MNNSACSRYRRCIVFVIKLVCTENREYLGNICTEFELAGQASDYFIFQSSYETVSTIMINMRRGRCQ